MGRPLRPTSADVVYHVPTGRTRHNGDSGARMTTELLEPVASLEEIEGSAVFPPS
jgi:hypothetical protein